MQKSRDLPFDMGANGGGYYATTNGYNSVVSPELHSYWLDLPARYLEGVSLINNYATQPSWFGNQSFSSTERQRPLFNSCLNIKAQGKMYPVTYTMESTRANSYNAGMLYQYGVSGSYLNAIPFQPDWNDADGASRRAWWSMQPRFEGEFQALNFIYELKDFKDIAKHLSKFSIKNVRANLVSVKRKLDWAARRLASGNAPKQAYELVKGATGVAAEVVLTKNFAVDPTVRDVVTLHGQLAQLVQQVQQEFFDRGKDVQSSHYTEILSETQSLVPGTRNNYWKGVGTVQVVKFTATMQYLYDYKVRDWIDALKRYYGLNVNAEVVWNALPFTFLVDYFLKVGQAIGYMQTDPNVSLRQVQYCESLLSTASSGTHYLGGTGDSCALINGTAASSGRLITGYEGTWYQRIVKNPNKGAALPRFSLPSTKQIGNIAALLRVMW